MELHKNLLEEIRAEQGLRMESMKKYYPFFEIVSHDLKQFQNGKYKSIDIGYVLMAVLRMLIEENNFNNTGVTYTDYLNFVIPFLESEFALDCTPEEYAQLAGYVFDKIKNDGKPFSYEFYDPEEKIRKVARVWLMKSHFQEGNIYYYITESGIEFYLNTKEFKEESKISIQQLLLEKMIRTQNFKGGREIVKRICNEVLKLKMQKREVLQVLVHDLKNGLSLYREFFQESVCWFDEEHDLFMKNTRLIAGAMSMLSPVDQIKNKEEIFLLDSELKRAMAMHSELLSECMDLRRKVDSMMEQGTLNAIRPVVYFRQFLETALAKDDVEQLKLLAEPLFQAKKKKMFDLKRLDEMLALRRGMDEEREEIESEEEADYVYDDELEEQRISSNYRILVRELFAMLKKTDCFTLREWNEQLEVRYGQKIFANGDYYSFLVNMCQKHEIVIRDAVRHPATNFEAVLKQYFEIEGTEEELQMNFYLETLTDEEPVTFLECFSVTNIRVERMNGDDRADTGNRD